MRTPLRWMRAGIALWTGGRESGGHVVGRAGLWLGSAHRLSDVGYRYVTALFPERRTEDAAKRAVERWLKSRSTERGSARVSSPKTQNPQAKTQAKGRAR